MLYRIIAAFCLLPASFIIFGREWFSFLHSDPWYFFRKIMKEGPQRIRKRSGLFNLLVYYPMRAGIEIMHSRDLKHVLCAFWRVYRQPVHHQFGLHTNTTFSRNPSWNLSPAAAKEQEPVIPRQLTYGDLRCLDKTKETCVIVSHDASQSGCPILCWDIANKLAEQYNIIFVILGDGPILKQFIEIANYTISIPSKYRHNNKKINKILNSKLNSLNISFALVNSIESRDTLPYFLQNFIPSIICVHEFSVEFGEDAFIKAFHWANRVIFSTKIVLNEVLRRLGTQYITLPYYPQGISEFSKKIPVSSPTEEHLFERLREYKQYGGSIVLGIGTIEGRKGVDLFISAAGIIMELLPKEKIRFIWVGGQREPILDCNLTRAQLEIMDPNYNIEFVGPISNLNIMYEFADVFLLSSRLDPLPSVLMGAAEKGCPVVCFDKASGYPELFKNTELHDHCVAPYLDTADMARKAAAFLSDTELATVVGRQLQNFFKTHFSMDTYVGYLLQEINIARAYCAEEQKLWEEIRDKKVKYKSISLDSPENFLWYIHALRIGFTTVKLLPGVHVAMLAQNKHISEVDALREVINGNISAYPAIDGKAMPSRRYEYQAALHIHAFYLDVFDDICRRITYNETIPKIFISTSKDKTNECAAILSQHGLDGIIKATPNKGRDIGPMLTLFADELNSYEIIGHVHTKKSVGCDEQVIQKWYDCLMSNLLGTDQDAMMDKCLTYLYDHPKCGLIFPDDPNTLGWTNNFPYAEKLMSQMDIPFSGRKHFVFPVGTMFWARSKALRKLFELHLTWSDYPEEPLPYDGTMLHAIERLLPFVTEDAGYAFVTTFLEDHSR